MMDLEKKPLLGRLVAEAIGAFAIVFFGCGAIAMTVAPAHSLAPTAVPLVFGLVVAAMVYAFGHVSGAHFNPAVTLAFAVTRHFPFTEVLEYCAAQCAGAILASLALTWLIPDAATYGATVPHIPALQALAWEALLTFFLMLTIMAVATDTRAVGIMAGAAIGAVVTIDAYVGGWPTGASMNPARSLGPAIVEGRLDVLWIYLIAPCVGAILGALTYKSIARKY